MNGMLHQIDWFKAAQVFQALLAPFIGVATIVIAIIAILIQCQQATTNRRQFRLALFDRRMKVFNSTMNLIALVVRDAKVGLNPLFQFLSETREVDLLFGPDIKDYMEAVYKRALELHTRDTVGEQEDFAKETQILNWFGSQTAEATKVFLGYLDFREP